MVNLKLLFVAAYGWVLGWRWRSALTGGSRRGGTGADAGTISCQLISSVIVSIIFSVIIGIMTCIIIVMNAKSRIININNESHPYQQH